MYVKLNSINPRLVACTLALSLVACGGGESSTSEPTDMPQADMGGTSPPPVSRPPASGDQTWTTGVIESGGTGLQSRLAVAPNGTVAATYFPTTPEMGETCVEIMSDEAPNKMYWPIQYAELRGTEWSVSTIQRPYFVGNPAGLGFAFDEASIPHIATMVGEPIPSPMAYCGGNDVALLTPSPDDELWTSDTIVQESDDFASGMPGSDAGSVVGYWPGLAFDRNGDPAIAYRDIHLGGIQGDDLTRADLELAWKLDGSWSNFGIDVGEGAGDYNVLLFNDANEPIVLYVNPVEQQSGDRLGLWVARSTDQGETWERFRLYSGLTSERPSMVLDPATGDVVVAFMNVDEGRPYIARWTAGAPFDDWALERIGDNRYIEGEHPQLAIDPNGHLTAVWYRCTRTGGGSTCDPQDDAVVFAWFIEGEWTYEVIDSGESGLCGQYPSIAFAGDGRAVVIYQCAKRSGDTFEFELRYARRKVLR